MMNVLVIGSGGREHALVWKLAYDSGCPELFCMPGNAGTAALATNVPIAAEAVDEITEWARVNRPDLTVIGPEAPLCAGLTDKLEALGLRVFGPNRAAAELEGSKTFAKTIMESAGVPTAAAAAFTDSEAALAYIDQQGGNVVIKADGLAAGKGVTVCDTREQAEAAIRESLDEAVFGVAGGRVLIEERLEGEEASILALVDGERTLMLAASQDHKRALDGDRGPNTGGMGAYSPAPVITDAHWPIIHERVFEPVLAELKRRGIVYKGVLYAGLMMTEDGPKVLEFNCRFGDPETQAILPRIEGDLLPALEACVDGKLTPDLIRWRPEACVCVVMASGGYPGPYKKGIPITGLAAADAADDTVVFHAGTMLQADKVVTAGGRVLGVTALGADLRSAVDRAYAAVRTIQFSGAAYRTDIAAKAL